MNLILTSSIFGNGVTPLKHLNFEFEARLFDTRQPYRLTLFFFTMSKAQPLSIESLLQKQREEKEAASKVR